MDYRKPRQSHFTVILVVLVAVGFAGFAIWRALRTEGSPIISVTGIPDSWTHKELAEHLERKGLRYKMIPANRGIAIGPAVYFVREGSPAAVGQKEAEAAESDKSPDVVYCQIRKTVQDAKDQVGIVGENGFSSGRFIFLGNPKALDRIRTALP